MGRNLDFPGYAQEFLRRNPLYRKQFVQVMDESQASSNLPEVMARNWGLSFPLLA